MKIVFAGWEASVTVSRRSRRHTNSQQRKLWVTGR